MNIFFSFLQRYIQMRQPKNWCQNLNANIGIAFNFTYSYKEVPRVFLKNFLACILASINEICIRSNLKIIVKTLMPTSVSVA